MVVAAVTGAANDFISGVNTVVKPAVVASVTNTFGFPLALMVMVALFLLLQPTVDRRDPRLRASMAAAINGEIGFEEEDLL